jgi:Arrestin (or S-antigen), C-terminal domain/Arrestin (or S-antigen), N-terminal domain
LYNLTAGIYIVINGYAHTHWVETKTEVKYKVNKKAKFGQYEDRSRFEKPVKKKYEGFEEYINSRIVLFGQLSGQANKILAGTHKYEFEYQLNDSLPSSLNTKEYEINYNVNAFLDIPFGMSKSTSESFIVDQHGNAALYPDLKLPVSREEEKIFCCCCCESDLLITSFSIPRSIYSSGQSIPIKVKYSNRSRVKVRSTKIKLLRRIEYKALSPVQISKSSEEVVVKKIARGIKARHDEEFEYVFDIPESLPASIDRFCKIIKITYKLVIAVITNGLHIDNEYTIPIVLMNGLDQSDVSHSKKTLVFPSAPLSSSTNVNNSTENLRKNFELVP